MCTHAYIRHECKKNTSVPFGSIVISMFFCVLDPYLGTQDDAVSTFFSGVISSASVSHSYIELFTLYYASNTSHFKKTYFT